MLLLAVGEREVFRVERGRDYGVLQLWMEDDGPAYWIAAEISWAVEEWQD